MWKHYTALSFHLLTMASKILSTKSYSYYADFKFPGQLIRAPYTVVNDRKRSRYDLIRLYFAVINVIVSPSYISVILYGAIWSYTEENGDSIRPPCTKTVSDRFFLHISPNVSVYDTEIYDRNTITCKPSYFYVYGHLRPCLFDLG